MKLRAFFLFILFISSTNLVIAQNLSEHEIGISFGIHQVRSDYGERFDSETNFGNQGTAIAVSYFYNAANSRSARFFQEHFKYQIYFQYSSSNLEHFGDAADDPRLEAMTGSYTNISINTGFEFYPLGILTLDKKGSSNFFKKVSPYLGIGLGLNFVAPDAESSLPGGLGAPENVFPTFVSNDADKGIVLDNLTTGSLNIRTGIRFKFSERSGIILESSWRLYGSDLVDGLSPVGPQNKNNDWSWGINLGYNFFIF
jgi:hypothetical protein